LRKLAEGVPLTAKLSALARPVYAAVPLSVAAVVPSYSRFTPLSPVIVRPCGVTVLGAAATLRDVAPALATTTFPEYVPAFVAAARRTYTVVFPTSPPLCGSVTLDA